MVFFYCFILILIRYICNILKKSFLFISAGKTSKVYSCRADAHFDWIPMEEGDKRKRSVGATEKSEEMSGAFSGAESKSVLYRKSAAEILLLACGLDEWFLKDNGFYVLSFFFAPLPLLLSDGLGTERNADETLSHWIHWLMDTFLALNSTNVYVCYTYIFVLSSKLTKMITYFCCMARQVGRVSDFYPRPCQKRVL